MLSDLFYRLHALFHRESVEADMDEEFHAHLERQIEKYVRSGLPLAEARRRARLDFGGLEQVKEQCRDARGVNILETTIQDARYALRMLRKNPGFMTVAVLTLALGIGANTAIFSLINAILLKPLPVAQPQELVLLRWESPHNATEYFPYPTFDQLRRRSPEFDGMFAILYLRLATDINGKPGLAAGQLVSGDYFSVLGVRATAGRTFTAEEDRAPGAQPVAVISYRYWLRQFGRDPGAVGKSITLNGMPFTIIGVSAEGFEGLSVGDSQDIWIPMMMQAQVMNGRPVLDDPKGWYFQVIARRNPKVSMGQASASLNVTYQQIARQEAGDRLTPQTERELNGERLAIIPASGGVSEFREHFRTPLFVLMALVGLVLLVACANVASLLLARASAREKEMAVRAALGAGRARLVRQLFTESLMLVALGAPLGLLLAQYGDSFLLALPLANGSPPVITLAPDGRMLAFSAFVSLLAAVLFGIAPAWKAARVELTSALSSNTRSIVEGSGYRRGRWGLRQIVVTEVALSLVLVAGAGMLVRSLMKLREVRLGFNPDHVLLLSVDPTLVGYGGERLANYYKQLPEAIRTLPGARSVTLSAVRPISPGQWHTGVFVQGHVPASNEDTAVAWNLIGPGYFRTLEIPLFQGREFTPLDDSTAPKVAIINEAMARFYFGNNSAIGRRLSFIDPGGGEIEIVGVAGNAKYGNLRESTPRMLYLPYLQAPGGGLHFGMTLEVRAASAPETLSEGVRQVVHGIDRNVPMSAVTTLAEEVNRSLSQERMVAELSSLFGALTLLLASIGLYGVMTHMVARRTQEIGIRTALGGDRREVLKLVLGEAFRLLAIGTAIGVPLAWAFARLISSQLYGISPYDPWATSAALAALVTVSAIASYLPARQATKVDPIVALRHE